MGNISLCKIEENIGSGDMKENRGSDTGIGNIGSGNTNKSNICVLLRFQSTDSLL